MNPLLVEFLQSVLMTDGIWAVLFVLALVAFYRWGERMVQGRLEDQRREINRLAQENREYRELFAQMIHDTMRTKGER